MPVANGDRLVQIALDLAARAHDGQTDKAGKPYILHPIRVAFRFNDPIRRTAAILHDVVEDSSVTLADLAALFPSYIVEAVDALTRRPGEQPEKYYARVRANPVARDVKEADLDDNTEPTRMRALDPGTRDRLEQKYAKARRLLAQT